jgi:hypothetical protein
MAADQQKIADALLEARRLTEMLSEGRNISKDRLAIVDAKLKRAIELIDDRVAPH